MNSLELALKKQRLLMESDRLRQNFSRSSRGIAPAFRVADLAVAGVQWIKQHPEVMVGVAVTFVVARPKTVWRLGRWAYAGWGAWKPISELLAKHLPRADQHSSN